MANVVRWLHPGLTSLKTLSMTTVGATTTIQEAFEEYAIDPNAMAEEFLQHRLTGSKLGQSALLCVYQDLDDLAPKCTATALKLLGM